MKLVSLLLIAFASLAAGQPYERPPCLGGTLISSQRDSITTKFNEKILTYRVTPETELWRRGVDLKSPLEFVAGDDINIKCAAAPDPDGTPIATIIASALPDDVVYMESHNLHEIRVCIGDLVDVQPAALTLKNDNGVCVVHVPAGLDIWRGKIFHETSALKIGDSVATRSTVSFPSGELTAELVEANVTKTEGTIISAAKDFIVVEEYPRGDEDASEEKVQVMVLIDEDTKLDGLSREDLKKGVDVLATGLGLGPTQFRATYITIEEPFAAKPPESRPQ